ncbi:MAG: hypothetical protein V1653_05550, partial [bacterium]
MKVILNIIAIIAICIFLAEAACRIMMPSPVRLIDNKTKKRIWLADVIESSSKGKRFMPNLDLSVYNAWISHKPKITLKTNSLGLRGDEISLQNVNNEFRVLVLGDSITWSGYLSEEDTFVFKLENLLKEKLKFNIRAINGGIGDVGITEEIGLLKEYFDRIKPKIVILTFYLNDSRPPFGFESEKKLGWAKFLQQSVFINVIYNNSQVQAYLMRHKILGKGYRYRWYELSKNPLWKKDKAYFMKMVDEADLDWGAAWNNDSWMTVEQKVNEFKNLSVEKNFIP